MNRFGDVGIAGPIPASPGNQAERYSAQPTHQTSTLWVHDVGRRHEIAFHLSWWHGAAGKSRGEHCRAVAMVARSLGGARARYQLCRQRRQNADIDGARRLRRTDFRHLHRRGDVVGARDNARAAVAGAQVRWKTRHSHRAAGTARHLTSRPRRP